MSDDKFHVFAAKVVYKGRKVYYRTRLDFYNGSEWKILKKQMIERATREDGFVYDELNGERIIMKGDIIVHHLAELTDDNVNDVAVSLNPDNLRVVSFRHHNEIHSRFGATPRKNVYWVYGDGEAYDVVNAHCTDEDIIVDIGRIRKAVSFSGERKKATDSAVFAARDAVLDCIYTRRGKWSNAWIVSREIDMRMAIQLDAYPIEVDKVV